MYKTKNPDKKKLACRMLKAVRNYIMVGFAINMGKLRKTFKNNTLFSLAIDCIDSINNTKIEEEKICKEILRNAKNIINKTQDKWQLIEFFSDPASPIDIFTATKYFAENIIESIIIEKE